MQYFILAALAVILDRLLKIWAAANIAPGTVRTLIPGILHLTYTENTGAAFSLLAGVSWGRWALIAVSAIASVALIVFIFKNRSRLGRWAAAAVLGGAVGNLIDRALTGRVGDMFELEFIDFAVFNAADIFATVGVLIFAVYLFADAFRPIEKPAKAHARGEAEHSPPPRRTLTPRGSEGSDKNPWLARGTSRKAATRKVDVFLDGKDFTETRILEEYDIERRIAQYDERDNGKR
ncbi:MAG: signal peptidase II [Oscillospiraceae bacterium]|jgi:signal peptidase II|nr:signal peptidase II [Oscillospiraceae bacterium]